MKIQFVRGFKIDNGGKFNYIRYDLGYQLENSIGIFMDKNTMHFRYRNKLDLRRIPDVNKSYIYVVIQDKPMETIKTLVHEITHFIIFKFLFDSDKLHNLLDKMDNPLI